MAVGTDQHEHMLHAARVVFAGGQRDPEESTELFSVYGGSLPGSSAG
jgi:hypothetical protein